MFLESHQLTYEGVYHVCCHPVCDTEKNFQICKPIPKETLGVLRHVTCC
jgi:hypothetical protein